MIMVLLLLGWFISRITLLLQNCVGQNWCTVTASPENFGGDPCPNVMKKLSVEAICT